MKILQLSKKFPHPLKDGETIAIYTMSKALTTLGAEVSLLTMNTTRHYSDVADLPSEYNHYNEVHSVGVDNRLKIKDAFLNLFSKESYHISRFKSEPFEEKLKELLKSTDYDVVQLETLYLAPYIDTIRKHSNAKIAMRSHNVEYEIWHRIASNTRILPKKWYLKHLTRKLEIFELSKLGDYDVLIPITERDELTFLDMGYNGKSVVAPIGLEMETYHPDYSSFVNRPSICFIGSLDWMPNLEGLKWFLNQAWPQVKMVVPNVELHIAGRNTPKWIENLNDSQINVHGEIEDAKEFINAHSIMIVPLFSGSGMRAKILEGMALGKVIVSTSLGLEGIDAMHKKELLIADTAQKFVESIFFCFQQNGELKEMGQKARSFVESSFDNLSAARKLLKTYNEVCLVDKPKHRMEMAE
jgi:glycosyltransferase involved in cell wall biosynthesis